MDGHPLMLVMTGDSNRNGLINATRSRGMFRLRRSRRPSLSNPTWAFCPLTEKELDNHVLNTLKILHNSAEANDTSLVLRMRMFKFWAHGDKGWTMVMLSLVRCIPVNDALSSSAITLFMDHCPLPTPKAVLSFIKQLNLSKNTAEIQFADSKDLQNTYNLDMVSRRKNICAVLGHLAETLAGGCQSSMFNENLLDYLLCGLDKNYEKKPVHPLSILHSLIAIEKFALVSENKRRLARTDICDKLINLQDWAFDANPAKRQVGFSAKWLLDNTFLVANRKLSYETVDLKNINAMLNVNDVSEYLKISPDGLEARSDASSFESVRCTFEVDYGVWYYEATIITQGVMQIGWATKRSKFFNYDGFGIGDDEFSCAYDGCRQLVWHLASSKRHFQKPWQPGDVLGTLLDIENQQIIFYMNGVPLPPEKQVFRHAKCGFFAAASFMSHQQCLFNFGASPFKYPPKYEGFQTFNHFANLTAEEKIVLPRHKRMELLEDEPIVENACTICCDLVSDTVLVPCMHKGICHACASMLDNCHLCRAPIVSRQSQDLYTDESQVTPDSPITSDDAYSSSDDFISSSEQSCSTKRDVLVIESCDRAFNKTVQVGS